MTSKRLGIAFVLVALFALWSLAGFGMGSISSTTSGDLLVGTAYAGDPDEWTNDDADGIPDNDPRRKNPNPPGPQVLNQLVQTLNTLASLTRYIGFVTGLVVWAF